MLGSKNHLFCDRRVYAFKGSWKDDRQDLERVCYYFVEQPLSLTSEWVNGRETLRPRLIINVFGEFPFCEKDVFTLQDGTTMRISDMTLNYLETNIAIRDMVKQRVQSISLTLE